MEFVSAAAALLKALLELGPVGLLAAGGWFCAFLAGRLAVKAYDDRYNDAKTAASVISANNDVIRAQAAEIAATKQTVAALAEAVRVSNELRSREQAWREMSGGRVRGRDPAGG